MCRGYLQGPFLAVHLTVVTRLNCLVPKKWAQRLTKTMLFPILASSLLLLTVWGNVIMFWASHGVRRATQVQDATQFFMLEDAFAQVGFFESHLCLIGLQLVFFAWAGR